MKGKTKLILTALMLVILLAGAGILYNSLSDKVEKENIAQNDDTEYVDAPDFTVYDKDNNPVKLSEFFGKPTVITFWASWCGVCKAEMPDIQRIYEEYGDKINIMMINATDGTQETRQTADEFLSSVDYTFPVYYDTTLEAGTKYGASALPTTYFMTSGGKLFARANYLDYDTLAKAVSELMEVK